MKFYRLEYQGTKVSLPVGEHVLGRGLKCWLRFNDPGVSREHLRLSVDPEGMTIEDLGSANGSTLNGERLQGVRALREGDRLVLGTRTLVIGLENEDEATEDLPKTLQQDVRGFLDATGIGHDDDDEVTDITIIPLAPSSSRSTTRVLCPSCGEPTDDAHDACASCGSFREARPFASTLSGLEPRAQYPVPERRQHPRFDLEFPVLYVSDSMTFESVLSDLSIGGLFVCSDILDEPGTPCSLSVLPDGGAVVVLQGVVQRIVEPSGRREGGMGIKFEGLAPAAMAWLTATLRHAAATQAPLP